MTNDLTVNYEEWKAQPRREKIKFPELNFKMKNSAANTKCTCTWHYNK